MIYMFWTLRNYYKPSCYNDLSHFPLFIDIKYRVLTILFLACTGYERDTTGYTCHQILRLGEALHRACGGSKVERVKEPTWNQVPGCNVCLLLGYNSCFDFHFNFHNICCFQYGTSHCR